MDLLGLLELLALTAAVLAAVLLVRRHYSSLLPAFRVDGRHGVLEVRRYAKMIVAEVRVTGAAADAFRLGSQQLQRYLREAHIRRFAVPLLVEKADAADSAWTLAVVLPHQLSLEAAPAPKNRQIVLRELPPHRAVVRCLRSSALGEGRVARSKAETLSLVNDVCRTLQCTKLSTVVTLHRFPGWVPAPLRERELLVRVTDERDPSGSGVLTL